MREARRPREGGGIRDDEAGGRGRIVQRAWWGCAAETWCQVREKASLVCKKRRLDSSSSQCTIRKKGEDVPRH